MSMIYIYYMLNAYYILYVYELQSNYRSMVRQEMFLFLSLY